MDWGEIEKKWVLFGLWVAAVTASFAYSFKWGWLEVIGTLIWLAVVAATAVAVDREC